MGRVWYVPSRDRSLWMRELSFYHGGATITYTDHFH